MHQRWEHLLFLHWKVHPDTLRPQLPSGLHLDLFNGEAWLGIVPFYMSRIRPAGLFPIPWLSWFLELNVRTYVHDDSGTPGVWFFSLDCNRFPAVEFARRAFCLPYQHASMHAHHSQGKTTYHCHRKDSQSHNPPATYQYLATGNPAPAAPDSLEFFLAERYLLYSADPNGSLYHGRVHHAPYQLAPAKCPEWSAAPAHWNGIDLNNQPPDSQLVANHVDVSVYPLQKH